MTPQRYIQIPLRVGIIVLDTGKFVYYDIFRLYISVFFYIFGFIN